jgi:hypothetical protein
MKGIKIMKNKFKKIKDKIKNKRIFSLIKLNDNLLFNFYSKSYKEGNKDEN